MDTNILLESGTNELEVLEFTLGDKGPYKGRGKAGSLRRCGRTGVL